jgi:type I restriction enzyme, R subunit
MTADTYIMSYFFVWLDRPSWFFLIADLQPPYNVIELAEFQVFSKFLGGSQDDASLAWRGSHRKLAAELSPWKTGTAAQKLSVLPSAQEHILAACAKEQKPEEHKQKFLGAVSDLSKAFALSVPHDTAIEIRDDVGFFQAVRVALVKSAGGEKKKSAEEMDHAIRQIISRAVASDQVVDIFAAAGLKKPDISILSDEFLAEVKGMSKRNLAVELLRKLLTNEIKIRSRKFLIQSRSFAELLEETLRKYQNRAIETAQVIEELIALAKEIREAGKRGEDLKLSEDEVAFYERA